MAGAASFVHGYSGCDAQKDQGGTSPYAALCELSESCPPHCPRIFLLLDDHMLNLIRASGSICM